jgi:mono/diheme cytochrome c family protein
MVRTKTLFIIFSLLLLPALTGCFSLAEDIKPPPGMESPPLLDTPVTQPTAIAPEPVFSTIPPDPNRGASIYTDKCAPCHGETGMGDGPDASILENPVPAIGSAEIARKSTPADWYLMVTQGNMEKFMPPFSSLSDQERWDVVAYVYTLSSPLEVLTQGEILFMTECAECHGDDGKQGVVDLTDQSFMNKRTTEDLVASITNGHELMPAFDEFSEDQFWALTAFLRSLTYVPVESDTTLEVSDTESEVQESDTSSDIESESSNAVSTSDGFGSITVSIGSASNEAIPTDLEITLRGYDEMIEVFTQTLTLANGTEITFDDIPLPPERMYFATMEYANALYGSDVLVLESGASDSLALDITYFPPTTDPSILVVDRLHVFLSFVDEQNLEIFQLYIFSNPTDQVLVPGEDGETAVKFVIPANAQNLYVEDNMSVAYKKTVDGFGIANIYPDDASYQVVYSYQVPYEDRKLDLSIPVGMDANAVIVMAPAEGFKVKSDQLEDAGIRDLEGVPYNMYTGVNLKMGKDLDLALSGRPKTGASIITTGDDTNTNLVIGLAGLGGALVLAGAFLWYRSRSNGDGAIDDEWKEGLLGETAEDLMDAIITLDDQYRTGGLPEGAYRVRRVELKERLEEIIHRE